MKKLLAIGLAAALLLLAAAPPARAENGRHTAFALGAGAGVLGTLLLGSILAPRPAVAVPAPVYAPPPPVVYYSAPVYYVPAPPLPPAYYYFYRPRR
jgi:hypothetical protein